MDGNMSPTLPLWALKDKYFTLTLAFFKLVGRGSYIWTSLLWGRQLLNQGLGWKLGIEDQINVWAHNWIPSKSWLKPFVDNYPDLIDRQSKTWNMEVLQPLISRELQKFTSLCAICIQICMQSLSRGLTATNSASSCHGAPTWGNSGN